MLRKLIFLSVIMVAALAIAANMGFVKIPFAVAADAAPAGDAQAGAKPTPQETISLEMGKDLQKKQEDLDRREEIVKAKEGQLLALEQDVQKKIDELKRTQVKLEEVVKMRDDLEAKNVANLTKAYSIMPPAEAAQRLKAMDRAIALKVLMAMKTKNSSKILSSLDPQTAAQISEQLAKRQVE